MCVLSGPVHRPGLQNCTPNISGMDQPLAYQVPDHLPNLSRWCHCGSACECSVFKRHGRHPTCPRQCHCLSWSNRPADHFGKIVSRWRGPTASSSLPFDTASTPIAPCTDNVGARAIAQQTISEKTASQDRGLSPSADRSHDMAETPPAPRKANI